MGSRHASALTAGCLDHMSWTRQTLAQREWLDVLVQLALSFTSSFAPTPDDIRKSLPV
jgi:hypothetical protein